MNILYFSQIYLRQGGGEKNLLQIGEYLKNKNNILLAAPMNNSFQKKAKNVFKEIFVLPGLRRISLRNILIYQKIKKIIQDNNIEIVHTINPRARLLAVLLKKKLNFKLVHTVHSSPFLYQNNFLKNFLFQKIEKFLNQRTEQIIFPSQNTKDLFLSKGLLLKKNWQVVYNGIDLEYSRRFFINKQEIRERVFEKFNLKKQTRLISFVGRFSFEKNLLTLVQVAPELVKEFSDLKFILVGDGEEKERLIREIKKNNLEKYFILPGFLEKEKVYEIVCSSDLFILPSFYETFSYTVLEALSLGTPVVASKIGGIQEMITSGVNGFLVPRNNFLELKEKIRKILKNKEIKEKFSAQGLKTTQSFSEEKMVQKIKQVYMSLYE